MTIELLLTYSSYSSYHPCRIASSKWVAVDSFLSWSSYSFHRPSFTVPSSWVTIRWIISLMTIFFHCIVSLALHLASKWPWSDYLPCSSYCPFRITSRPWVTVESLLSWSSYLAYCLWCISSRPWVTVGPSLSWPSYSSYRACPVASSKWVTTKRLNSLFYSLYRPCHCI